VEELEILERVSRGETRPRAASAIGTTERTVGRVLAAAGGRPSRRSRRRRRSPLRLSLIEREEIRVGDRRRRFLSGDREATWPRTVDDLSRSRRRAWTQPLSGNEGRRPGLAAGAAAEALQARLRPETASASQRAALPALLPAADLGHTEAPLSRRSGAAHRRRDDLPIALCPVAGALSQGI
jgi:hypothetical protein